MQDLNVTLIQAELAWENIQANLAAFDNQIAQIADETDLIILPEMFTTGFSMNADAVAEDMEGSAVHWLKRTAIRKNTTITGSLMIRSGEKFVNRLVWSCPDGELFTYDKRHLFRMAGEEKVYREGSEKLTINIKGWNIRPFICYDIRFPIWTRNIDLAYDLAFFVANWPQKRASHWKTLLKARAIENQCYVVGVNRVGIDGNEISYSGDSAVIDPVGTVVFEASHTPCIHTQTLSCSFLQAYRGEFPAWMDADLRK